MVGATGDQSRTRTRTPADWKPLRRARVSRPGAALGAGADRRAAFRGRSVGACRR